ncbi:RNA transcription, translation and transport factor protein [Ischnura elegans]|uniref:RNA transcription, translation and transport factor protein n=1 Tax=Ischnura elegans TaxID=197161 RepID=UPI001ED8B45B|nr:RNA transcription, translation and transport factor protein [Ischnura elegans]
MFRRKLTALDYHAHDNFNVDDDRQFRSLIVWLEDQKIRHYKIEDRENLRNITSPDWPSYFQQYNKDLVAPDFKKREEQLDWLLSFAVRLDYADNAEKYKDQTSESVKKNLSNAPKVVSENPLDNLDFEADEFKKGVNTLAQLLNVTQHPDHLITLSAISKVVTQRLSAEALENPKSVIIQGTPFPVQEADLGFDTGDYVLNQAAKVLRLLHIHELRDLQTKINECIVSVQSTTANPKTDTRLGKVGF